MARRRCDGRLGVFRASVAQPACVLGGAGAARMGVTPSQTEAADRAVTARTARGRRGGRPRGPGSRRSAGGRRGAPRAARPEAPGPRRAPCPRSAARRRGPGGGFALQPEPDPVGRLPHGERGGAQPLERVRGEPVRPRPARDPQRSRTGRPWRVQRSGRTRRDADRKSGAVLDPGRTHPGQGVRRPGAEHGRDVDTSRDRDVGTHPRDRRAEQEAPSGGQPLGPVAAAPGAVDVDRRPAPVTATQTPASDVSSSPPQVTSSSAASGLLPTSRLASSRPAGPAVRRGARRGARGPCGRGPGRWSARRPARRSRVMRTRT